MTVYIRFPKTICIWQFLSQIWHSPIWLNSSLYLQWIHNNVLVDNAWLICLRANPWHTTVKSNILTSVTSIVYVIPVKVINRHNADFNTRHPLCKSNWIIHRNQKRIPLIICRLYEWCRRQTIMKHIMKELNIFYLHIIVSFPTMIYFRW